MSETGGGRRLCTAGPELWLGYGKKKHKYFRNNG